MFSKTKRSMLVSALALVAVTGLLACQSHQEAHEHDAGDKKMACCMDMHEGQMCSLMTVDEAVATLVATKGNSVTGVVRFSKLSPPAMGIKIVADIQGLEPNSTHGFHLHEFGDGSSPDGMAAGGHYNPDGHQHGGPASAAHHAGDLGNVTADAKGVAHLEIVAEDLTIAGMKNPVLGRSVILHAKADDLSTQPTGNAGARIACGVIGIGKSTAAAK